MKKTGALPNPGPAPETPGPDGAGPEAGFDAGLETGAAYRIEPGAAGVELAAPFMNVLQVQLPQSGLRLFERAAAPLADGIAGLPPPGALPGPGLDVGGGDPFEAFAAAAGGDSLLTTDEVTIEQWRQFSGGAGGAAAGGGGHAALADNLAVLAGDLFDGHGGTFGSSTGPNGHFTIELAQMGIIDGRVRIEAAQANIWLAPRNAQTRTELLRGRGSLERAASAKAGFDVCLTIV